MTTNAFDLGSFGFFPEIDYNKTSFFVNYSDSSDKKVKVGFSMKIYDDMEDYIKVFTATNFDNLEVGTIGNFSISDWVFWSFKILNTSKGVYLRYLWNNFSIGVGYENFKLLDKNIENIDKGLVFMVNYEFLPTVNLSFQILEKNYIIALKMAPIKKFKVKFFYLNTDEKGDFFGIELIKYLKESF